MLSHQASPKRALLDLPLWLKSDVGSQVEPDPNQEMEQHSVRSRASLDDSSNTAFSHSSAQWHALHPLRCAENLHSLVGFSQVLLHVFLV